MAARNSADSNHTFSLSKSNVHLHRQNCLFFVLFIT